MLRSLNKLYASVLPVDESLDARAREHLDNLTKPKGSLGRLEDVAARLFCIAGGVTPLRVDPGVVFTVAGDHGVAAQGVSPYPQIVTRQMVRNFLEGGAAINVLCNVTGIEQNVVDAGCAGGPFEPHPRLIDLRLGEGTADISQGPAMSAETCRRALLQGATVAAKAAGMGYRCVGTGDMGIANTTSAAALCCAYLGLPPEVVVGAGAGLDAEGVARKIDVVRRALEANRAACISGDPTAVLAALGGFEIAVTAGIILGAAQHGLAVLVDGFISGAAYVAALRHCPAAAGYCFLAHSSAERGHAVVLKTLGAERPLLDLGMRLGEGTGGALALVLLRAAAAVFNDMATFGKAGVDAGSPA